MRRKGCLPFWRISFWRLPIKIGMTPFNFSKAVTLTPNPKLHNQEIWAISGHRNLQNEQGHYDYHRTNEIRSFL